MNISISKRILMFVHWLLSLLICAALAVYVIVPDSIIRLYQGVEKALGVTGVKVLGIALLVLYAVVAVFQICLIFGNKKHEEKGFITVDSDDQGKVRIAVSAIEQMVRDSVDGVDGIAEMQIDISDANEAIAIDVNSTMVNGSHVPTVTMNMQRAIRQFVESNCGVAVRNITISINAVTSQADGHRHRKAVKAEPAPAQSAPVEAPRPVAMPVEPDPVDEPIVRDPVDEPIVNGDIPAAPDPRDDAPAFDPDAPYESQFQKDLDAMKRTGEEPSGDDDR